VNPGEPEPSAAPASSPPESVRASGVDRVGALAQRVIAANARLSAIAIVTAIALIVLGAWMYAGVKHSLEEIRAGGLRAVLEAEVKALQLWVDERKQDAARWANDARVQSNVAQLAAVARTSAAPGEVLWRDPAQAELAALLAPLMKDTGAATFHAIDANGVIVASGAREDAGRRIGPGGFHADLSAVFQGETRFIPPHGEEQHGAGAGTARPMVWVAAPVRGDPGTLAALAFGYRSDDQFGAILRVARPGRTGEVYAFDERGLMLSEVRSIDQLHAAGLLPKDSSSAVFRVQVRDPGGDLAAGHRPDLEPAARPLTRMAALAIASRGKPDAAEREGVIVTPYRNYRGIEVISAWRWLADYDMGVAIEVGAEEAYAPLRYLDFSFSTLLALLVAALAAVLWSAWNVRRLRREVGEARVVGQYRLERQIGEGGMGKVYLARHALLKRPTALKMLKPHLATDEIAARFEREVQLASQLVHPNTIEIYDYGRTREGVFYYVMEYLEGATLDRIVAEHGRMPVGRAIHVLLQVCAALREAHGRGLVHRDIKPHNIMLCQRGGEHDVAKILDFGLVKDLEGRQSRDITQFQRVLGTPLYMSPERIRNPSDADARSDIYSVGAVAFFLLTGRELFETGGEHDLVYHVLHTPARRPSELVTDIPRRLDDLVVRCLAKDRAERPHDVLVVLALLEAVSIERPWLQREAEAWWARSREAGRAAAA